MLHVFWQLTLMTTISSFVQSSQSHKRPRILRESPRLSNAKQRSAAAKSATVRINIVFRIPATTTASFSLRRKRTRFRCRKAFMDKNGSVFFATSPFEPILARQRETIDITVVQPLLLQNLELALQEVERRYTKIPDNMA
jgi:hypothetical protein